MIYLHICIGKISVPALLPYIFEVKHPSTGVDARHAQAPRLPLW